MIREIRIYLKLRPYINRLKEELHMKFSWNMILQVIATAIQGVNAISGMLPHDQAAGVAVIVGVVQAVAAAIAHFSNPDGTSAKVAYIPDSK